MKVSVELSKVLVYSSQIEFSEKELLEQAVNRNTLAHLPGFHISRRATCYPSEANYRHYQAHYE